MGNISNSTVLFDALREKAEHPENEEKLKSKLILWKDVEMLFWTKEEYLKLSEAMMDKPQDRQGTVLRLSGLFQPRKQV